MVRIEEGGLALRRVDLGEDSLFLFLRSILRVGKLTSSEGAKMVCLQCDFEMGSSREATSESPAIEVRKLEDLGSCIYLQVTKAASK